MRLHNDTELFGEIVQKISSDLDLEISIIKKDYFVFIFLREFSLLEPSLIFKGGTSLSKCYHVINRFSEDLDLTFVQENGEHLTGGERRRVNHNVKNTCKILGYDILNLDSIWSDKKYNCYDVETNYLDNEDAVRDHIKVEVVMKVKAFPIEMKEISSFVSDFLLKTGESDLILKYQLEPFKLSVQSIERTFIDKIFAICDYYIEDKIKEKSRHLYDVHQILPHIEVNSDLISLIIEVRDERLTYEKCYSAKSKYDINNLLKKIISLKTYEYDYENITKKLLYDDTTYNDTIDTLQYIIKSKIFID